MVIRVANRDAGDYVTAREEFKGSNISAIWYTDSKGGERYAVYSYGTHFPMYVWEHGVWYANVDKWSRSTSQHQSLCHPGGQTVPMDTDTLKTLIRHGIAGVAVGM